MTEEPEESEEEEKELEYSDPAEDLHQSLTSLLSQPGFISGFKQSCRRSFTQLITGRNRRTGRLLRGYYPIIASINRRPSSQDIAVLEEHRGKGLAQSAID